MMNAQELMAHAAKAATLLFKKHGEVIPILHMVDENDVHIHVHFATGFAGYDAKQSTSDIMRKALKEAHAVRYALVLEAWTVDERGDTKLAEQMSSSGISLEKHPDRIEVVTIFVEDKHSKECLSRMYQILRPEHGKPTLSPPKNMDLARGQREGRFTNLFEERGE